MQICEWTRVFIVVVDGSGRSDRTVAVGLVVVGQREDYVHQELKTAQRILIPRPRRIVLYRLQITTSLIYVFSKYRLVITTIIYVMIRIRLLNTLQLGMDFLSLVLVRKYKVILLK